MIECAPVIMAKFRQRSHPRLSRSRHEDAFELSRRLARFHNRYVKGNARLALLGKSSLKRSPFSRLRAQADRSNRLAHRPQKLDRAFRDDYVNGILPQFEPEQSIGGQCGDRVDAPAEGSPEMIGIQGYWRFDNELIFIMRHNPHAHCAGDWNLLMKILLGVAKRGRETHVFEAYRQGCLLRNLGSSWEPSEGRARVGAPRSVMPRNLKT